MTAPAAAWRLDRLSPEARDAAETAALKAGQPLSAWLGRLIAESCASDDSAPSDPTHAPTLTIVAEQTAPDPEIGEPVSDESDFGSPDSFAEPAFDRIKPPPAADVPAAMSADDAAFASVDPPPVDAAGLESTHAPEVFREATPLPHPTSPDLEAAPIEAADELLDEPPSLDFPGTVISLPINRLVPGKMGTRRVGETLPADLVASIATAGLRQPVLVRPQPDDAGSYEIVAGRRRWRAAQRIGLSEMPAIVESLDDAQAILASLRENFGRHDFGPLDEARSYLRLLTENALSADDITDAIGCHRQHVVRSMRLLGLPGAVRTLIDAGPLNTDQALLLLDAKDALGLARAMAEGRLTIDQARGHLNDKSVAETTR